jgi:ribosomal protein S18 acetylase RimI-like enzyme
VPWEHGVLLRTPSVPGYWDYNCVRVDADPGCDATALIARADELQPDVGHRKVEVEDEAAGARVRPGFAAAGWMDERLAFMLRESPPPAPHPQVEEAPYSDTRALRAQWYADHDEDPAGLEAFAAEQDTIVARRGLRAFVVRRAGVPVGFASLAVHEGAMEIDQLYVRAEQRGTGMGRALLETALAAGGQARAWIVADDEGRARALYERTGFATVWRPHAFIRLPEPVLS